MNETPVVELIRVSTAPQAGEDRQGIPAQRTINRETCTRFSLRVVETVEIVESGATVATSAAMARVLDLVGAGGARGIVLAAYDRLFRPDRWTDLAILQVIADQGAVIYVPAGPIDLRTEQGFMQAGLNNLMAGSERWRIRDRTVRAKDEMRRQGKLASGSPPFGMGYDKASGRWFYTDAIAEVREIFRLFLSGEERCYARLGERFGRNDTAIMTILRRPAYAGWLIYPPRGGRTSGLKAWPPIFPEAPDGCVRAQTGLPPAVPVEEFLEAQRIIQLRASRISLSRASSTEHFLYRGLLSCACTMPIYGIIKHGRRGEPFYYYGCRSMKDVINQHCTNKHMVRTRVEVALDRILSERLTDPELIGTAVETYNDSLRAAWRDSAPDAGAAKRRRTELERRRARVMEAFFGGLITRATCDEEVGAIDAQLRTIPRRAAAPRPPALRPADVLRVVRVFRRWPRLSWQARREVLEALAPVFVLHRYRIEGVHLGLSSVQTGGASRRAPDLTTQGLWVPLGAVA